MRTFVQLRKPVQTRNSNNLAKYNHVASGHCREVQSLLRQQRQGDQETTKVSEPDGTEFETASTSSLSPVGLSSGTASPPPQKPTTIRPRQTFAIPQQIYRYPRSYATAHLDEVRDAGPFPHLRVRGLDVDSEIAPQLELSLATHDARSAPTTRMTGDGWVCVISETSTEERIQDMRILYIDDQGRTFRRAWRMENDVVTEQPEPPIGDVFQLLSRPSHELAGERAAALTSIDPGRLIAAFDINSPRGWHLSLPESPDILGATPGHLPTAHRERVEPQVTGRGQGLVASSHPSLSSLVTNLVRQHLRHVEIPTSSGSLRLFATRYTRTHHRGDYPGYTWGQGQDLPEGTAQDYNTFWTQVRGARTIEAVRQLGIELHNTTELAMWRRYLSVAGGEGDIASVNTYDDQLLTIGAGFSSRFNDVVEIYERMPEVFHRNLYQYGIYVDRNSHELVVLDTERGAVTRGTNALRILQTDQQRLGVLIQAAMSGQSMAQTEGGESAPARLWMLRSQFEQFRLRNRGIPAAVWGWPQRSQRYAFLLRNWASSLPWTGEPSLGNAGPNGRRLAVMAYTLLRGRWSGREGELWTRLKRLGTRCGFTEDEIGNQPP